MTETHKAAVEASLYLDALDRLHNDAYREWKRPVHLIDREFDLIKKGFEAYYQAGIDHANIIQKDKVLLLAKEMVYRGNSVDYWYIKATAYKKVISDICDIMQGHGLKFDGDTCLTEILKTHFEAIRTLKQPSSVEVTEWQSMDTAPRDGTPILALEKYSDSPAIVKFRNNRWAQYSDGMPVEDLDAKILCLNEEGMIWKPIRMPVDDLRMTNASATAEVEVTEWQSMDTAPKDGTEVLLLVKRRAGIGGKCLVGHYMPGGHCIEDHPPIDSGWYFWNGCMFDEASEPTHWMPLPEPPSIRITRAAATDGVKS